MGSSQFSSSFCSLNWTFEQHKLFENALAIYDKDNIPDRWQKIANLVGGTNEQEVKKQYEILLQDINHIESGKIPLPNYRKIDGNSNNNINGINNEDDRPKDEASEALMENDQ